MDDTIYEYYKKELSFIRAFASDFARAHPAIAGRLQIEGTEASKDPHVERLIEAFALLSARVRLKLDDDFPELTDSLLSLLYPHFLAPVPSMAVVQFALDAGQADMVNGIEYQAENTLLTARPRSGNEKSGPHIDCRYRTCYPVSLFPIRVASAALTRSPVRAPCPPDKAPPVGAIRIAIEPLAPTTPLSTMKFSNLRFFIHGQSQHVCQIYEMIFERTTAVMIGADGKEPAFLLPADAIKPVGFDRNERMLPYPSTALLPYRLLMEYFVFRHKFLFFDLAIPPAALAAANTNLDIFLNVNTAPGELEQHISAGTFRLGCTPVVNLFPKPAEPFTLNGRQTEYRLVLDEDAPLSYEIYSVDSVAAAPPSGDRVDFVPFFSFDHRNNTAQTRTFWAGNRRESSVVLDENRFDHGTEMFLQLIDLDMSPTSKPGWTVEVQTTCLNRDLPASLGLGVPRMELWEGGVAKVECLTEPTRTGRPPRRHAAFWRLLSQLSVNYLSITREEHGADLLREILRLHDLAQTDETRAKIDGVRSVTSRRGVARTTALCRGTHIDLRLREDNYPEGGSLYLFATILERFLALYSSINSYTQLTVLGEKGTRYAWPARAGEHPLV